MSLEVKSIKRAHSTEINVLHIEVYCYSFFWFALATHTHTHTRDHGCSEIS